DDKSAKHTHPHTNREKVGVVSQLLAAVVSRYHSTRVLKRPYLNRTPKGDLVRYYHRVHVDTSASLRSFQDKIKMNQSVNLLVPCLSAKTFTIHLPQPPSQTDDRLIIPNSLSRCP
ncbi:unnamed protein product, partial [Ectocarpus sp. 8 AP-2014]